MDIGQKIRNCRECKGLSLTQVSQITGFSISFLSQVERNLANPSINSLKKISDALETQLANFFIEENETIQKKREEDFIVRANKRKKLSTTGSKTEMYLLSPDVNHNIELVVIIAQPGGSSGEDYYTHEGEECGIILEGTLEIELDGKKYTLNEGDSMLFKSEDPHRWVNNNSNVSVSLWAITPPSY